MKILSVLLILFSVGTLFTVQSSSTPAANAAATVSWIDIPTPNSEPTSIVSIPAGFAFTERQGNKIGVFTCATSTEDCSLTEFPVPTPQSEPLDIAIGLANPDISSTDVAIWFTESASKKIGRLLPTQQHVIQELDLKLAGRPRFLAVAKDSSGQVSGDVWFTESAAWFTEPPFSQSGAIWRINPVTLAATRYAIPKNYADPWGIAIGPDRTVWVKDGQDLLKVSETSGVTAVYPIPWWTTEKWIAVDSRSGTGHVWLTGSSYPDSYLVSFDPSTLQFTKIGIGGFQGADNIEVDDGGNVWFASWMTGQIATFRPQEGSMSLFNLGPSEGIRGLETTHDASYPLIFATGNKIGILSAIYGERSTTTSSFPSVQEGALVASTWTYVTTTLPASIVYQTTDTVSTSATKTTTTTVTVGGCPTCTLNTVTKSITATVYGSTTTALQTTTATVFEIPYTSTRVAWTGTNYEYQGTMTIPTTTETAYVSTTTATTTVTLTVTGCTCTSAYRTVTVATTTIPDTLTMTSCVSTVTLTNPTLTPATETASVNFTTPGTITVHSVSLQWITAQENLVVREYGQVAVVAFVALLLTVLVLRRKHHEA